MNYRLLEFGSINEDYEKKVKTVMVNNFTNINHHSLNTKRGSTPSDVVNAGHDLGQDK
jgi:hypothetical protein